MNGLKKNIKKTAKKDQKNLWSQRSKVSLVYLLWWIYKVGTKCFVEEVDTKVSLARGRPLDYISVWLATHNIGQHVQTWEGEGGRIQNVMEVSEL